MSASLDTLFPLIALLAASGVAAGLLAGLLGVGGGIVIVPILFWILSALDYPAGVIMHTAVATSLLAIIPTSISSSLSHHRRGNIDPALLRRWIPALFVGALAGGISSRWIGGAGLSAIFGVVALLVSINMATRRSLVLGTTPPASPWINRAMAAVIGFVSALMGIGGGTLAVPALTAFSFPILKAVGTSSAFGLVIAIPAVFGFIWSGWGVAGRPPYSLGYVSLPAALVIVPLMVGMAPVGARIASSIDQRLLKLCFAVFLAATAVRMLFIAFGG